MFSLKSLKKNFSLERVNVDSKHSNLSVPYSVGKRVIVLLHSNL